MDHNPQGRRPQYHRGRRGSDRRGGDRRTPAQAPEQGSRPSGDHVDVEQIMRDIRARIAQRHGIELTTPQIQELAARRLEAILDPRTISPTLTEQLRRAASSHVEVSLPEIEGGYTFDENTLFETHRGVLRFMRRLLNPILKLLFNPNPLIQALSTQARLNKEAAVRETDRERRQAEWNALHYEILTRLVTEVSRVAIDVQALASRVESLTGRVDFADKRVRTLESHATQTPARPQHTRDRETPPQHTRERDMPRDTPRDPPPPAPPLEPGAAAPSSAETPAGEGSARRKRRRRRGRRSGTGLSDTPSASGTMPRTPGAVDLEIDADEPGDDDAADMMPDGEPIAAVEASAFEASATDAPAIEASEVEASVATGSAVETSSVEAVQNPEGPADEPVQPAPPPDEPAPAAPVDHPDPGPPDR